MPRTRAQLNLPKLDPSKEDLVGSSVAEEVQKELRDALGDSPIGAALGAATCLVWVGIIAIYQQLTFPFSLSVGPCMPSETHGVKHTILQAITVSVFIRS